MGIATSEFQMSCAMSQRVLSFTHRTMYLPESTAGAPGGRLAAAGQAKRQRPRSTAIGPLAHTESARTVSTGGGLDMVFSTAKNARIESRPCTGGMFGGRITANMPPVHGRHVRGQDHRVRMVVLGERVRVARGGQSGPRRVGGVDRLYYHPNAVILPPN